MTLPVSGPLSLLQIRDEFGDTNPVSLSEYYRGGGVVANNNTGVPTSGAVSISNFYGAAAQFAFTNATNYSTPQDLRSLALVAGWNGSDALLMTNNAIISSNTTATPALTISGSFPNGVQVINNSTIVGMGGAGGAGNSGNASAGGTALSVSVEVSINNTNGVIAGGGGGAGGGTRGGVGGRLSGGGGGGGGRSGLTDSAGGAAGSAPWFFGSAGAAGTYSGPGGGGSAGNPPFGGAGGTGGDWGSSGANGVVGIDPFYQVPGVGGAGGAAVTGSGFVTWLGTGTRYGDVS